MSFSVEQLSGIMETTQHRNLEFDERFLAIDEAISEHELNPDGPLRKGQNPFEWHVIAQKCLELMEETRDLRLAVWYLRANAETNGLAGWAEGMSLISDLMRLDASDVFPIGDDHLPTGALHAMTIGWLPEAQSVSLFNRLRLVPGAAWSVNSLLLSGEPLPGDLAEALKLDCQTPLNKNKSILFMLEEACAALANIKVRLESRADGREQDLTPFIQRVEKACHKVREYSGNTTTGSLPADNGAENAPPVVPHVSIQKNIDQLVIASRSDVQLVLNALNEYYTKHETGHPAPIFIQRLQRMVDMNFESLLKELFSESDALLNRLIKPLQS